MRITSWIPMATNTLSVYVISVAIPPQQWMQKCASLLGYKHTDCFVSSAENNSSMMGELKCEVGDASAKLCGIINP